MLIRPHDGGVDGNVPVDLACGVGRGLDLLEQTLPRPVGRPQPVPFINSLPRPKPFGQVTPLHAGPHAVQNPVDHLPVVPPPATTPVADRQERPQPFPLSITQITPPHGRKNDPDRRQSQDHTNSDPYSVTNGAYPTGTSLT
jgi:hypothetical protein